MRIFLDRRYGKIELPELLLEQIGIESKDKVKIYLEDNRIIIEKEDEKERYEEWIDSIINLYEKDNAVFLANHKSKTGIVINVMIDIINEEVEVSNKTGTLSREYLALLYAKLKKCNIPRGIEEYIENK